MLDPSWKPGSPCSQVSALWSSREEQREVQALWSRAVSSQATPCYGTATNGFSLPFTMSGFSPAPDTHRSSDGRMALSAVFLPSQPRHTLQCTWHHFHLNPKPHIFGRGAFIPCNFRTNFQPPLKVENGFGCRAETVVSPQHWQLHLAEHVFPWQHGACKAPKQLGQNSSSNRPGGLWRRALCKTNPPLAKCSSVASDEEADP